MLSVLLLEGARVSAFTHLNALPSRAASGNRFLSTKLSQSFRLRRDVWRQRGNGGTRAFRFSELPASKRGGDEWIDLRVVSYNIHGWRDASHADNFDKVKRVLGSLSPDVMALQEVLHPYSLPTDAAQADRYLDKVRNAQGRGYKCGQPVGQESYLLALADATGLPYVSFGKATEDGYFGQFGYGNAILSRFPIVSETHAVFEPEAHHQLNRRMEAEQRSITIVKLKTSQYNTHTFCVAHIDQLSDALRAEQLRFMLPFAEAAGPHFLCGDFNMFQRTDCTPEQWDAICNDADTRGWERPPDITEAMGELHRRGYQDCFYMSDDHKNSTANGLRVEGMSNDVQTPGATLWPDNPLLRIDYAFLSSEWGQASARVKHYQRLLVDASDHFPIVVDLQLSAAAVPQTDTAAERTAPQLFAVVSGDDGNSM